MLKGKKLLISAIMLLFVVISYIITPLKVSKSYNGMNFDFDNDNKVEPVTVSIKGILKRDLMLRPKTFEGTILIDSNQFEITNPISLSLIGYGRGKNKYYEFCLDFENVQSWKLNKDSLYNKFGERTLWCFDTDRNFSYISMTPIPPDKEGGWLSSSEVITAPCNNREEAIEITYLLRTGSRTGGYFEEEQ